MDMKPTLARRLLHRALGTLRSRGTSAAATALALVSLGSGAAHAQDLYDPTVLRTIDFTFHDANWWTLLQQNYAAQTNILADMTVLGVTYPSVGVRIRGNTSYTALPAGSQKVSLDVEVDFVNPGQNVLGYSSLNLNNSFHDPTFCREVAYNNFVSRFMPNARANHVVVTLNGANWGVYANVQQYNKDLLREWFADEDGMRIKCANNPNGPGLRYVGTNPTSYAGYEVKETGGLADPIGELIQVCNVVTNEPLATWQNIDTRFAIDPSTWSVVLENLLTDDDSYVNKGADFMLYRDPSDGRTHLHQTDANETFTAATWSHLRNFTQVQKPVLNHVLAVPELRQRYMAHYRHALSQVSWAAFDAEFTAYRNLIDAAVQADPKKLYTYQNFLDNFTATVNLGGGGPSGGTIIGLQQFITQRLSFLATDAELNAQGPNIATVQASSAHPAPGQPVWITASVSPTTSAIASVELFYKPAPGTYSRVAMLDDGLSGDGAALDGVYGALLPVTAVGGQRVQYYVMAKASNTYGSLTFFPRRTEIAPNSVDYTFGSSGMRITEYMYQGANGEFVELTNTTASPIDLAGWSLDDDSAVPGTFDLSAAGIVAPGQSVIVADVAPATFASAWGLTSTVILGPNASAALGRNDQINVYDAGNNLVERLTYGDESFPGSIRTRNASGQTCTESLGQNAAYAWSLASLGDPFGSRASTGADLGTPGAWSPVSCNGTLGTAFCFGDGSGVACPCANNGANGHGCANSAFAGGASLIATGVASVASDTALLSANDLTGAIAIFFQGDVQVPDAVIDDGIGCVGGSVVRLGNNPVGGAAAIYPDLSNPTISVRGGIPAAGGTYSYQCFYRNASTVFCPPATSNRTNGVRIVWTP